MVEALLASHAQNHDGVCEFIRRPLILHSTYPTHGTARQLDLWRYYIWKKLRVLDGRERSSAALGNKRQSHRVLRMMPIGKACPSAAEVLLFVLHILYYMYHSDA
jgi:hypothetical protein